MTDSIVWQLVNVYQYDIYIYSTVIWIQFLLEKDILRSSIQIKRHKEMYENNSIE